MIVFIPAAGLGTRLRPLTDTMPKALVPYQGKPLLVHLLERMESLGFRDFVINLHHFSDMLASFATGYAREKGLNLYLSDESECLLDTGGALTHALPFFRGQETVLVHNVDIMSDLDPGLLLPVMQENRMDAVLSVRKRESSRLLYSDSTQRLRAWKNLKTGEFKGWETDPDEDSSLRGLAFSGIHLLKTSLIEKWASEHGTDKPFSVIDAYLEEAPQGKIWLEEQHGGYWKDMGKITDFHS